MGYAWAVAATAVCTLIGLAMWPRFDLVNIAMVYLLAVVLVALRFGCGPVATASVLGVAAFDYFFVVPAGTFNVDDPQYLLTFGMMLAVGLIISYLTETVRERARAQARLALEAETERVRSALLSSISHDLRTPLAVITGASSSLAERGDQLGAEERRVLARSVFERATDMAELVNKVLQMTRLETGAVRVEPDWDSLGDIAGSVMRRLHHRLATHLVMVDLPADLPMVRVDTPLIEQVIGNLLENAARHTPPRTVVRLRGQRVGDELIVSVEDFGPGLADGDLERIFQKFNHGAAGGVGLGLAICRAIVMLHQGRIWAESIPGGGTAFRFALPLEAQPSLPAEVFAP